MVAQALQRHPNTMTIQLKMNEFSRDCFTWQTFKNNNVNIKTYPVNIARINLQGEGEPLEDDVLQMYEDIFETDLSDVIIHEGEGEAEAAGALAFTAGNHIYFAEGRYDPYSEGGTMLLGHELAHVIQQKEGRVKNPLGNTPAFVNDPIMEAEADRMGLYALTLIEGSSDLLQMMKKKRNKIVIKRKRVIIHHPAKKPATIIKRKRKLPEKEKKNSEPEKKKRFNVRVKSVENAQNDGKKGTILEILQSARTGQRSKTVQNSESGNATLRKLKSIMDYALKDINLSSSATAGIGYESSTGNIYPVNCTQIMVNRIKAKKSTLSKKAKVQQNEDRNDGLHVEMLLIKEHPLVNYIYTSQDACVFCYGYMCQKNNITHQPLRNSKYFPTMWAHPDQEIFLDIMEKKTPSQDDSKIETIECTFQNQMRKYKIRAQKL
jgi:hypothetical protein